jgi:hypothetical protein
MPARISFPFPVLGNNDDVAGELAEVELSHQPLGTVVEVFLSPSPLSTGNSTIDELIAQGKAAWFLRMHCARTYYRRESVLDPKNPRLRISTDEVEGAVTAQLFVIALSPIDNYRPSGLHPDYGDATFAVAQGEVLTQSWVFDLTIEPRFDPMKADAKSLIQFLKDDERSEGPFEVECDSDTINVMIPTDDWNLVAEIRGEVPDLLHSCIALPAVVHALGQRTEGDTRRWAARLTALIQERNITNATGEPLIAAQRLLENPLKRGLAQLEVVMDGNSKGGSHA